MCTGAYLEPCLILAFSSGDATVPGAAAERSVALSAWTRALRSPDACWRFERFRQRNSGADHNAAGRI
eukprot:6180122-Pleurochrysis_carterae.AAC.1